MLTLSSAHVNLNANAAWCDSRTLRSLYNMASSFPELHRKPLSKNQLNFRLSNKAFIVSNHRETNARLDWILM